jgi:hypothetical protein
MRLFLSRMLIIYCIHMDLWKGRRRWLATCVMD